MYWLNIDRPTGVARLHRDSCDHAQQREETHLKGVGSNKSDGGWHDCNTRHDAQVIANADGMELSDCEVCRPA